MEEVACWKKKKEEVVTESRKDLKKVVEILKKEKDAIALELKDAKNNADYIGKCPNCGKDLVIRVSRNNKQFVGCSGYPRCTTTYPLPQKKKIEKTDAICERCGHSIIKIINGRQSYEMCLNHNCITKKEYKENQNNKNNKETKKDKKDKE